MRILIVDDDRMICAGTARRIVGMGIDEIEAVECAYSGEEALSMLSQRRFDAMFSDIRMGEMDGLQLVRQAKALNPNLICVMITAFDRFQYAQQAIRLGVEDFLVKPLSIQSMRGHVQAVVDKYRGIAARKESQLELEISAQTLSGERDVDECFRQCGLSVPAGELCMAVWSSPWNAGEIRELDGVWHWSPRGGQFHLTLWEGSSTMTRLDAAARRLGGFVGVSGPERNMKRMADRANAALRFAWMEDSPCAVEWSPQREGAFSGLKRELMAKVRMLDAEGVRSMLEDTLRNLSSDCRQEAGALVETVWNELRERLTAAGKEGGGALKLTAGMGIPAAMRAIQEEIGRIRRAETDLDQINPVAYAKRYVSQHLYEPVDMAVVANQLNLSYAYFSRIFREQAGTTFTRYLVSLRMQEVCRLLLKGEKLVDIAEKLGYQNAANLTRSFTREFGVSPSRWLDLRKQPEES